MNSQQSSIETPDFDRITSVDWDVIVVGAGPAGVIAAREVAKRGRRVLLVDKSTFPRAKVCGGCLNLSMLATLDRVGLTETINSLGGITISSMRLSTGQHTATLPLPGGISVSREAMDEALIRVAVQDGVTFLPGTRVSWSRQSVPQPGDQPGDQQRRDRQELELKRIPTGSSDSPSVKGKATASVVVIANGLAGMSHHDELDIEVEETSLVGAGCVLNQQISAEKCFNDFRPHVIYMAHNRFGYVGVVRVEDNRLNIAAAIQPAFVSKMSGLGAAVAEVLSAHSSTDLTPAGARIAEIGLRGTPILTRRANRIAGPGFFVVGDAAGYIEPFTGEGMAWAALGGEAVAPLACEGVANWTPQLEQRWTQTHQRLVKQRQKLCRQIAWLLRRPTLSQFAVRLLDRYPNFATPVINRLNAAAEV